MRPEKVLKFKGIGHGNTYHYALCPLIVLSTHLFTV